MDPHGAAAAAGGEEEEQQDSSVPMHTSFCPYCNIHLQYPAGSQLIQCPSCSNTLDPNSAHQTRCTGCSCLLAYPPQSLYIQCPKCFHTMDPRQMSPLGAAGSAPVRDGGSGPASSAPAEPKKRRDPNAPKAVCNAYMIFCKSRRGELKNELPELAFGKIGAKLGEMWRNMTQEEKKPYEDRAMVDRERYRKEMVEYTAGRDSGAYSSAAKRQKHEEIAQTEEDQKLERDVAQQRQKAAARARRERQQQQQEDEEASGGDEHQQYQQEEEEGEEEEQ